MPEKSPQNLSGQEPSEQQPSEQDRLLAMGQYQFLADLARRCPLRIQTQVLDQVLDEHRLATQAPLSRPLNELLNNRAKLREELRQRIVTLSASWNRDQLSWNNPVSPLNVAKGLTRFVIVEMQNATDAPLTIAAASPAVPEFVSSPVTIPPGSSQPLLLEIA